MQLSSEMRRRLVEQLRRGGYLHDPRVVAAFREIPREVFLAEQLDQLGLAGVYRDDAIVTRRDPATRLPTSSSSQPAIMALMLEMLDVQPGQRVLEIGTGTGYNAAILARLVGPEGRVVSVDIDADVARRAARALRSLPAGAQVVVADGTGALPLHGVVDRIEVTASGTLLPRAWYEQLAPGGRLVVPLRLTDEPDRAHAVTAFVKVPGGFDSVAVTAGGFMPLRHPDGSPAGALTPAAPTNRERPTSREAPTGPETPSSGKARTSPDAPAARQTPAGPEASAGPGAPASSAPDEPDPELPAMTHGPVADVGRDDVPRLRIKVRYGRPPLPSRWIFERDGQWIGVDLPGAREGGLARPS